MEIDLRERKRPKFNDLHVYESDDVIVRQNNFSWKLGIYKKVLGLTEVDGKEAACTKFKFVTDVREASGILKEIESEYDFHPLQEFQEFHPIQSQAFPTCCGLWLDALDDAQPQS